MLALLIAKPFDLEVLKNLKLALSLILSFSYGQLLPSAMASDWIDENVDEVKVKPRIKSAPVAPYSDENYLDTTQSARRARLRQPSQPAETQFANEEDSQEEITPPAPVMKIDGNGSGRIIGGVSSATVRTGTSQRSNRGLDNMAAQFMRQAPYLAQARTATVQPAQFKAWLERAHAGESTKFARNTIVEVKGKWDDCGHILRNFGLPFTKITQNELATTDLLGTKILTINCGCVLNEAAIVTVRKFVQNGGYLLSTDWALDSCLQKAFPGYVEWNSNETEKGVVDAVVVDRDPILLAGVPKVAHWQLEDKSQMVRVIKGRSVQVLARSRQLASQDQDRLGILALSFPFGKGRVLHLVGHFDNNANLSFNTALPDPAPIIGIGLRQAIAANFIMAALHGDVVESAQEPQSQSKEQ